MALKCPKCGSENITELDFEYTGWYNIYVSTLRCNECGHEWYDEWVW